MKILKSLVLILIILGSNAIFGQVTITSSASSQIVPLTAISELRQLSFGQFTPLGGGGNITVSTQGTRSATGNIILKESAVGQAVFSISGTSSNNLSVLFPNSNVNIYHQNHVNFMYLDSWTIDITQTASSSTEEREIIIKIGCTLNVGSIETNPIGFYTGSYSLTFFYN